MRYCAFFAVLLAVSVAEAASKPRARGRTVILPLIVDDAVDPALSAAAQRLVRTAADQLKRADIVGPAALRSRIKNPHKPIERCGEDAGCLAKLGKRAQATAIVASR